MRDALTFQFGSEDVCFRAFRYVSRRFTGHVEVRKLNDSSAWFPYCLVFKGLPAGHPDYEVAWGYVNEIGKQDKFYDEKVSVGYAELVAHSQPITVPPDPAGSVPDVSVTPDPEDRVHQEARRSQCKSKMLDLMLASIGSPQALSVDAAAKRMLERLTSMQDVSPTDLALQIDVAKELGSAFSPETTGSAQEALAIIGRVLGSLGVGAQYSQGAGHTLSIVIVYVHPKESRVKRAIAAWRSGGKFVIGVPQ